MKYAKPVITLEKFALGNQLFTASSSLTDGPIIGDNGSVGGGPSIETQSSLGNAFGEVFDFSQK